MSDQTITSLHECCARYLDNPSTDNFYTLREMVLQESWIPAQEQVPETNEKMLVSCKTKKGIRSINLAYYMRKFWHGQGSMSGVEAWMPLPIPYYGDDDAA